MKKWLFNPFVYIAGVRALLIGGGIMIITAVVAFYSRAHFDGALDMHCGAPTQFWQSWLESSIDLASLVIPFYILGRIFSDTTVRLIDIVGTVALARWPMLLMALLAFMPVPYPTGDMPSMNEIFKLLANPYFIVQVILTIPLIVWNVALLYNAYSVSTNLKKSKAVVTFIAGLIIAEVLSKVTLAELLHK